MRTYHKKIFLGEPLFCSSYEPGFDKSFFNSYIFCYIENLGLSDVRTVHRPLDQPLIKAIAGALNSYIETRKLHNRTPYPTFQLGK
jgi:hypothetical protein